MQLIFELILERKRQLKNNTHETGLLTEACVQNEPEADIKPKAQLGTNELVKI